MPKKKENEENLLSVFSLFIESKKIDRTTLVSVLEDSFRSAIQKKYGSDENFKVIVNPDKGDFEIYRNRTVVEDEYVKDQNAEISLSEAKRAAMHLAAHHRLAAHARAVHAPRWRRVTSL